MSISGKDVFDVVTQPPTSTNVSSWTDSATQVGLSKVLVSIYVSIMILVSCVGTVGNVLVISAVIKRKELRVLLNVFIVNLACADFMVSVIVNPAAVVGILDMGKLFHRFPAICEVLATLCVISFVSSIWSLSFVALNRYVYICHKYYYPRLFTHRSVVGMVIFIWTFALLLDLPNYLGWGDHSFDMRNFTCCYDYSANFAYTRGFLVVLGFIIPVGLVTFSYIRIYLLARRSRNKMSAHQQKTRRYSKQRIESTDKRLLKTIGVIWIVFMIMWTPYAFCVIFDFGNIRELFVTASLMAFMNSSVNCMIYASNRNFRKGYKMILKGLCCQATKKDRTSVSMEVSTDNITT